VKVKVLGYIFKTKKMKVLLVNGSPHLKGCTWRALHEIEVTLNQNGIETDMIHVGQKPVQGCIACYKCKSTGRCVFDDVVNEVAPEFETSDGIVIGTPVYYASPAGTIKSFLDRLFMSTKFSKRMKVGAAVASCRRAGSVASLDMINRYFSIAEMPVVSSQYWNEVHGNTVEEVEQDLEGLQTMRVLARNMAFLMRAISAEKIKNGLPETEVRYHTNFIKE
jgi:multimeric flavodoxin WrbA